MVPNDVTGTKQVQNIELRQGEVETADVILLGKTNRKNLINKSSLLKYLRLV